MKYAESELSRMASPISRSEDEKSKNSIRMIKDTKKKLNYPDDRKEARYFVLDSL